LFRSQFRWFVDGHDSCCSPRRRLLPTRKVRGGLLLFQSAAQQAEGLSVEDR
jgi:hypothetical protein